MTLPPQPPHKRHLGPGTDMYPGASEAKVPRLAILHHTPTHSETLTGQRPSKTQLDNLFDQELGVFKPLDLMT